MEKLIIRIFLWLFIDDNKKIGRAIDVLYGEEPKVVKPEVVVPKSEPVKDKRSEIIEAIQFLKSKPNKTKSDKDKIHMLEVVLKSV